jgi:hypothetical protein
VAGNPGNVPEFTGPVGEGVSGERTPASKGKGLVLSSVDVWDRPVERPGYLDGLSGLGGMVAPLLAGFSLTAITLILTATKPPGLWSWALVAFAGAVAFLLQSMQLAFFAIGRDPRPATQLDWYPEALIDADAARRLRKRQAETFEKSVRFWHRSMVWYDLGLTAFLSGVVLLLIPAAHHWTGQRIAAVAIAGAAFVLEAWWVLANRLWDRNIRFPHPAVSRSEPEIEVEELDPELLWAIADPARFAEAARQTKTKSSDGTGSDIAPKTAESR